MASWFGDGLQSLDRIKNQVSSSLKEVFEEDGQDPSDLGAQVLVAKDRVETLNKVVEDQKAEIAKLKERNQELLEEKEAVEVQKEVQCQQFRELLKEKEEELTMMSQSFDPDLSERMADVSQSKQQSLQSSPDQAPVTSSRIAELELQLRQERESHQNEMMVLQETLSSSRPEKLHETETELLDRWNSSDSLSTKEKIFREVLERLSARDVAKSDELLERVKESDIVIREQRAKLEEKEVLVQSLQVSEEQVKELSKTNAELLEKAKSSDALVKEMELMEEFLNSLKAEKEAYKQEKLAANELITSLQSHQNELKTRLADLEDQVVEQSEKNQAMGQKFDETKTLNEELQENLRQMTEAASNHDQTMKDLRDQLESLQSSSSQMENLKEILAERQAEMDQLKESLKKKASDTETLTGETSVYKKQYEALLEEYNQYLNDLEALQAKAENLEELKTLYEEETKLLMATAKADKETVGRLEKKSSEDAQKLKRLEAIIEQHTDKVAELESVVFKERTRKRELEGVLEEKEALIDELKADKENRFDSEEKDVDEAEEDQVTQAEFDELKKELESSKRDLEETKTKLQDMTDKLHEITDEKTSLEAMKEALAEKSTALEEALTKIQSLEEEIEQHKAEIEDEASKFEEQSSQLQDVEEELERYKSEVHRSNQEVLEHSAQLNTLQEELDGCIQTFEQERTDFQEKLARLTSVQVELDSANEEVEKLRAELATSLSNKPNLESQKEDLDRLKAEKEVLEKELEQDRANMNDILSEKSKENSKLKSDIESLMAQLAQAQTNTDENKGHEMEQMRSETVTKLSNIIRDKDIEIEALKSKNESLLLLASDSEQKAENNQIATLEKEKQDLYEALAQKHQESLTYYNEIQRLVKLNESLQDTPKDSVPMKEKTIHDNSNEIKILKDKIKDLEQKLTVTDKLSSVAITSSRRQRCFSENLEQKPVDPGPTDPVVAHVWESKVKELESAIAAKDEIIAQKDGQILEYIHGWKEKEEELCQSQEELRNFKRKVGSLDLHQTDSLRQIDELKFECGNLAIENKRMGEEKESLVSTNNRLQIKLDETEHDLEMAKRNLNQVTEMLEEKSQNSESVQQERLQHIAAIQELQSTVGSLKRERDEVKVQLESKERELLETRREVNNVIDKKKRLELELERLREHLVAVEEGYTQEALASENRERELRKKLQITEEALRVSSLQHTASSQEATQQVGTLEQQVKQLQEQRDQLLNKLSKVIQESKNQESALENLTMVLEGFQREKENDLKLAEKDFKVKLAREEQRQEQLKEEIQTLKDNLEKANEGLAAANRLSEQLEKKSQIITTLKQEIKMREELLRKAQTDLSAVSTNNAGKVDKSLVKNLVVGYLCADTSKRGQVLKLVATVLDFNQEERQKTGLEGGGSWLGGWLGAASPSSKPGSKASDLQRATGLDQSLAQAFVQFLEAESTPKVPVKLPVAEMAESKTLGAASPHSRRSSVNSTPNSVGESEDNLNVTKAEVNHHHHRQSPNPLMTISSAQQTLPTFSVNRSSSAILKHVLQDDPKK